MYVIVRAFNEGPVIRDSLLKLRERFPLTVVVDDGSWDNTVEESLAAGATVVRHPFNLGAGAALQTGLRYVAEQKSPIVATFDPDGQHRVEDLVRLVDMLREQQLDVVIGSRFAGRTEGIPWHRLMILRAAMLFTAATTGVRLSDPHNGLRVMTGAVARTLNLRQDRFAYASELVAQLKTLRLKYAECPVTITYTDYSLGKGQKTSNSVRILFDLLVGWLMR